MTKIAELPVKKIVTNAGTLVRELHKKTKDEYVEAWKKHADFPPLDVFFDGKRYLLADGLHRLESAIEVGHETIVCTVHDGGKRDTLLFAVESNDTHGLRRTNKVKRDSVKVLLKDKEWGQWSNADIGRVCNVSTNLVRRVYREMVRAGVISERKTVKTTRQGKEVSRKANRSKAKVNEGPTSRVKSGTSKKRNPKTQDDIARDELAVAIANTRSQPFDGAFAREKKLFSAKDAKYMREWWTEAAT